MFAQSCCWRPHSPRKVITMISVMLKPKLTLVSTALFAALLALTGCGSEPVPPAESASGFEFAVNPQTEQVTLAQTTGEAAVQQQATPSDSRILVPGRDVALRNLTSGSFQQQDLSPTSSWRTSPLTWTLPSPSFLRSAPHPRTLCAPTLRSSQTPS